MLFTVTDHYIYTTSSDVHHYANNCDNECHDGISAVCLWQEDYSFCWLWASRVSLPGFCNHWRQCTTLFTHSV